MEKEMVTDPTTGEMVAAPQYGGTLTFATILEPPSAEIDFVAERRTERLYVQVCYSLSSEETVEREYRSLRRVPDNHPKLVLSLDAAPPANRGGIRWQNLVDFLLDEVTPR